MTRSRFVVALFLIVVVGTTLAMVRLLGVFLSPIVLALVLVSLFKPVNDALCGRIGGRRRVAATVTTILIVLGVVVPLVFFVAALAQQALDFYERTLDESTLREIRNFLSGRSRLAGRLRRALSAFGVRVTQEDLDALYADLGRNLGLLVYERVREFFSNVLGVLFQFAVMIVVLFSLLLDGSRVAAWLKDLLPLPDDEEELLAQRFRELSRAIFVGNGVVSALQGAVGGLGFYLFDVGPGLLWGAVMAALSLLPVVGASIVFVPATLVLAASGQAGTALAYFAFNAVLVTALEYGVKPRLIGGQAHMPTVLVFISIVGGIRVFGILGIFYGPLVVTMFLTIADIYKAHYRDDLLRPGVAPRGVPERSAREVDPPDPG
jgi:predicted PurR-regulated permease PerM